MKLARNLNRIFRSRATRILLPLFAFVLLASIVPPRPAGALPAGPADVIMTAAPVALDSGDPSRRRVGALVFLRGWKLDAADPRFGGLSAMQVEGRRVTAVNDAGTLFQFDLPRRPGMLRLHIRPLTRSGGVEKRKADIESMVFGEGEAWLGFERINGIARFDRPGWREQAAARPRAMRRWRSNNGPEAMVRLPDGRFLVFAESRPGQAYSPAVLFDGDPADPGTASVTLRYRRPEAYRVTDAAILPDGRLLLLNRMVRWLEGPTAKLVVADPAGIGEGATIAGQEIATLRLPLTVDNMEALSVTVEGGRTIVRIASDDNFMSIQRTLLLEFALDLPPGA